MNQMRKKLAVSSPFNSQRQKLYPFIVLGTSVQHEMFFFETFFSPGGKARSGSAQTRFWFANEMEEEKQEVKILWRSAHRS